MQFSVGNWTSSQKRPSNVHQLGTPYHLAAPGTPLGKAKALSKPGKAVGLLCSALEEFALQVGCNEVDAASLRTLLSCQRTQRGLTSGGRVAKEKPRRPDRSRLPASREESYRAFTHRRAFAVLPSHSSPLTDDGLRMGVKWGVCSKSVHRPFQHENAPRLMSITDRPTIGRQSNTDGARGESKRPVRRVAP